VKKIRGLYLAGQINGQSSLDLAKKLPHIFPDPTSLPGTTGYEEAGAQGILAGLNAGLSALDRPPLTFSRAEAFLGVMVDDLITKGAEEPCEHHIISLPLAHYDGTPGTHICFFVRSDVHQQKRVSYLYSKRQCGSAVDSYR
jgi:hypothetical protein